MKNIENIVFEFDKYRELDSLEEVEQLEETLKAIWEERKINEVEEEEKYKEEEEKEDEIKDEEKDERYQPFLKFSGIRYKARNYTGFISSNGRLIEIYPKVFINSNENDRGKIISHILFWLHYCKRINFPFTEAPLGEIEVRSFPELIIYLFAVHCLNIIETKPYSRFEEITEELSNPRGRIDFKSYISNNASYAKFHIIDCVHEPFVYDNKLNRAIKFVSRLLINFSKNNQTQKLLQDIIHILDEVTDEPCSANELEQMTINPLFTDYIWVKDFCVRFLRQQMYSPLNYENKQWVLLFPMEYIFEDYVAGIIKKHFSDKYEVSTHKPIIHLSHKPDAFRMINDIYLKSKITNEVIIIDTKYKLRNLDLEDKKEGVSQSDMYQMLSYAYRHGCKKIILMYPNVKEELQEDKEFHIQSAFNSDEIVDIYIKEIPFWSLKGDFDEKKLEEKLKIRLEEILINQIA
ncbi:MAG: hypothetical protein NTY74_14800 [Ignavibacteriae bacterium]|nr:hypothetical protein [Ignavibacteriota bacterium]